MPFISQIKSLVQIVCDDPDGAHQTQENFVNTCPFVSQVKSATQAASGDTDGAKETQMKCCEGLNDLVDGTPVIGHAKACIHYAEGNKDAGDKAMKSASRTTGVSLGGTIGFAAGGPPGAFAGGIIGGLGVDGLTTCTDSLVHGEPRPSGSVAAVANIIQGNARAGDYVDLAVGTAMDGVTGKSVGDIMEKHNTQRLYKVTKYADDIVKNQKISKPTEYNKWICSSKGSKMQKKIQSYETWFSESDKHSKQYLAQKLAKEPNASFEVMKVKIPKDFYQAIKEEGSIPQRDSATYNKGRQTSKNLINYEKLENHPQGKSNIGLKGDYNLDLFNDHIMEITKMDPNILATKSATRKFAGRYLPSGLNIVVSLIDKLNHSGPSNKITDNNQVRRTKKESSDKFDEVKKENLDLKGAEDLIKKEKVHLETDERWLMQLRAEMKNMEKQTGLDEKDLETLQFKITAVEKHIIALRLQIIEKYIEILTLENLEGAIEAEIDILEDEFMLLIHEIQTVDTRLDLDLLKANVEDLEGLHNLDKELDLICKKLETNIALINNFIISRRNDILNVSTEEEAINVQTNFLQAFANLFKSEDPILTSSTLSLIAMLEQRKQQIKIKHRLLNAQEGLANHRQEERHRLKQLANEKLKSVRAKITIKTPLM